MKHTILDTYNALTWRAILLFFAALTISVGLIEVLGYMIWRRFPVPVLIVFVASLGWRIGRRIGHQGLSQLLNAASVGLGVFGLVILAAAVIDGAYFTEKGYVTWTVMVVMWMWIALHTWRAWQVLKTMPPDRLIHVTAGTEAIYAQMVYREARIQEALDAYEEATKAEFRLA